MMHGRILTLEGRTSAGVLLPFLSFDMKGSGSGYAKGVWLEMLGSKAEDAAQFGGVDCLGQDM